ncbi:hypothetical protein C1J05_10045 [Sulfitobacter sp. JL08]|uniref:VPLPA-CTERM sorting domain-containing protein n=1 Tax=Sulfitobacter sp. JL08 TaxID=2070369 RepID=UPI000E0AFC2D|nr:VPLPA-CTERM sorting domain-containing protein [Sulfitobacter sp. JL08]AXI54794.1 hypothetical protein C1J05_10045 [Sulfitobacter sp. JL08]
MMKRILMAAVAAMVVAPVSLSASTLSFSITGSNSEMYTSGSFIGTDVDGDGYISHDSTSSSNIDTIYLRVFGSVDTGYDALGDGTTEIVGYGYGIDTSSTRPPSFYDDIAFFRVAISNPYSPSISFLEAPFGDAGGYDFNGSVASAAYIFSRYELRDYASTPASVTSVVLSLGPPPPGCIPSNYTPPKCEPWRPDGLSPVPLPAALPMLLAGVGGLGFIARRRRKSQQKAA